jgi:Na+/H+ antiporter NhaD/arsenite permease-like protein
MSIAGISGFILFSSQLLGNVAVVQLARPNVQQLADPEKKLAWAIIAFVSTVGGNLTITGSAGKERLILLAKPINSHLSVSKYYRRRESCQVGSGVQH